MVLQFPVHEQQEAALQSVKVGGSVGLEPEADNPQDPAAVLITVAGVPVGWVPRLLSAGVRELLHAAPLEARVHRVNGVNAPFHLRLALDFDAPAGVEVRWIVRPEATKPGTLALAALAAADLPASPFHAFIAGEQSLPTTARRDLVARGVDKGAISFVGYWRVGAASPTPKSQTAAEH